MCKKLFLISVLLIAGFLSVNVFAADPNLVARYTFDNSNAADSSGYGRNGTEVADVGTLTYVPGKDGMALSLSGGAYINCGGYNDGDPVDPFWGVIETNISTMAWIKLESGQFTLDKQAVFTRGDNFRINRYNQTNRLRVWAGTGQVASTSDVNDGQWHHIAGTHDGHVRRIYIDGRLESTANNVTNSLTSSEDVDSVLIGNDSINGNIYGTGTSTVHREWQGCIDDVRLYNRVVTYQEILEISGLNTAQGQTPDGAKKIKVAQQLSWSAAFSQSRTFNIYYGKDSDSVKNSQPGHLLGDTVLVGGYNSTTWAHTFDADSTYYWRVDVVDGASIYPDENIHTFSTDIANSYNFLPADGETGLNPNGVVLRWTEGSLPVTGFNVYFGTSQTAVTNRTSGTKVSSLQTEKTFTPSLAENTTYYWLIEDVGATTVLSPVMMFSTATALDPNLIGWWDFETVEGTSVMDASGKGHVGTLVEQATVINDIEKGKVLSLDGAGDYVNLGNGAWTNPGNSMTVTAWFKVDAFNASYQTIIAKGNQTYRLGRRGSNNELQVYMNYTASSYRNAAATTNVNDGKWHHAATTYDGDKIRIFIDGNLEGSSSNSMSTLWQTTANLCIGRNTDQTGRDWQGCVDDVRLYNRALDGHDILNVYREGVNYVIIDDMEDYNDITKPINRTTGWLDNDYNDLPGGHCEIGTPSLGDPTLGQQSLKFKYNSWDDYHNLYYHSECVKVLPTPEDWSYNGSGLAMLYLRIYGKADNDADKFFVALKDSSNHSWTVYHPDLNVLVTESWQTWKIPLSDFTGVDLTKVKYIYLGCHDRFDLIGTDDEVKGDVYIDDVRLYPPSCNPDIVKSKADFNNDCVVDLSDLKIIKDHWLEHDVVVTPQPVSDSNLESLWNFDNGNANDSSGNGHDCTEVGMINYIYDADRGSVVLSVDGTVGNYLNAGGGAGGWATFTKSMTYCTWFKVNEFTSNMQCIIGNDGAYRISRNGTTDTMRLWNDGLGGTLAGKTNVNDGQWHHACGVVDNDGTTTKLYLYIDGKIENSVTKTGTLKPLVDDLIIASDAAAYPGREWNGLIDDVRFYSRALSHGEILTLAGVNHEIIITIDSDINLSKKNISGQEVIDYKDFAFIADNWLSVILWP